MRNVVAAVVAATDAAVLGGVRGDAEHTLRCLPHLAGWFATAGTDRAAVALAATALWLAAAWLALGLAAALASRLPGTAGRAFAALGRAVLPRAMRGLVAGAAGVGVVVAPLAASAAPLAPGPLVPVHAASAPAHASSAPAHTPAGRPAPRPLAPPVWPRGSAAPHAGQPARQVTVRPGDSLWLLATSQLAAEGQPVTDRRIAAAWPRWYVANRGVIGADPDLLRPGQRLTVPPSPIAPAPSTDTAGGPR